MASDDSSIERLKRSLYSRDESQVPKETRSSIQHREFEVPTGWGDKPPLSTINITMTSNNNNFFKKFFIGAVIFFVVSLAIAAFFFFDGLNMISSNNVDIKIVAPSSINSGEELDAGLSIKNGNRADLQDVALYIDYPAGVKSVENQNIPVARQKVDLGSISQGGNKDYLFRATVLGEKDAVKTVAFTLEYKIKGSNAVFSKEKTLDVTIGSSPLLLDVSYPKETNSGQNISVSVDVTSNSSTVMHNVLLKVEYPYGFTYTDSNMKPLTTSNAVWNLGDMKNGDKKTVTINGTIVGQNMDDRSFRISVGTGGNNQTDLDTALAESVAVVGIRKSFFDLSLSSPGGAVARAGGTVSIAANWQNTLPDKIVNAQTVATLSGNLLDRAQVTPSNGGYYRSADNTISWDKTTTDGLNSIDPGQSGELDFSVGSLSETALRSVKNPHIDVHVDMTGTRSGQDTTPVESTADLTVKFESNFQFSSKTYRYTGPLTNSGPVPPKADKETTYTITWTMTNTSNDLSGATATGVLPQGAVWKGVTSPSSERISYNPDTRTVTWNAGNVSAGSGYSFSPKEVSFQVGLTPNVTQVGTTPVLVSNIHSSATDTYTNTTLSRDADSATTRYSDQSFTYGSEVVVK